MAHPFNEHRAHKVEKRNVAKRTKEYARGGMVKYFGEECEPTSKIFAKAPHYGEDAPSPTSYQRMAGGAVKQRADKRARGGRTKGKGKTTVNVIVAPQGGHGPMPLPPAAAMPHPAMPAPHPMMPPAPPPGGMPLGGAMPPGLPHRSGGRTYAKGGKVVTGRSYDPKPFMSPTPGKNDLKDMNRKKVVTYATGGPIEAPDGVESFSKAQPGGSGGGEGRLKKSRMTPNKAKSAIYS